MDATAELSAFGHAILYFLLGFLLIGGGVVLSRLLAPRRPNPEKLTAYECGEDPIGSSWLQFNMRFYVMGLVFLIFDVELLLLFPWVTVFADAALVAQAPGWAWFALAEGLFFIAVLVVGLVYVWAKGDIDWIRPQPLITEPPSPVSEKEYLALNAQLLEAPKQPA